jgi:Holliday junction DNA helicase RuvB
LGVDHRGLTPSDRAILKTIVEKFKGGPVGLNTLAASMSEEEATIEEYNEPYLLQIGFIERTPRGRVVTDAAYKHIDSKPADRGALL